jgi:mannose-1-phosphate guanylyltransferase
MYAVIMAGGSGTRFWPCPREDAEAALEDRGRGHAHTPDRKPYFAAHRFEDIFIVTNQSLADTISQQLSSKFDRIWDGNFILNRRRKIPRRLWSCGASSRTIGPRSVMVVLSADHSIRKADDFLSLLQNAYEAARNDYLVTFGIKPDRPETGYGYIKAGEKITTAENRGQSVGDIHKVEAFVEKPDLETAKEYLKSGRYFWNSGIFVWKTKMLLGEIKKHQPALFNGLQKIRNVIGTSQEADVIREVFKGLDPSPSIMR